VPKETKERIFADLKDGMQWTTLRGLKRAATPAMLVFAAISLKKTAACLWKTDHPSANLKYG